MAGDLSERVKSLEHFAEFALRHTSPSRARVLTYEETYSMLAHHPAVKDVAVSFRDQPQEWPSLVLVERAAMAIWICGFSKSARDAAEQNEFETEWARQMAKPAPQRDQPVHHAFLAARAALSSMTAHQSFSLLG